MTIDNFETHNCYTPKDFDTFYNPQLKKMVVEWDFSICKVCGGAENDLNVETCEAIVKGALHD